MSGGVFVIDTAGGLRMCVGADIAYVRHSHIDDRAIGVWEVIAILPHAVAQVFGGNSLATRPAVVDDFGSLVFVGPAQ